MIWRDRREGHTDLCGTDPELLDAATPRYPSGIASCLLSCEGFPIKSFVTREIIFQFLVSKSASHPKTMIWDTLKWGSILEKTGTAIA